MVMVVSILGLFSTAMLLNDPPSASEMDLTPLIFEINSAKLSQVAQRNVASQNPTAEQDYASILEVKCDSDQQSLETSVLRMRIKGANCLGDATKNTWIKNNSNGFVATVFHKPDFSFTTDYINLTEGKNEITVAFETNQGVTKKNLVVTRAPSSIKK